MKKITVFLLVLFASGCSAQDTFVGKYKRVNASAFEVQHQMNSGVLIEKTNDGYSVILKNGYGDIPRLATLSKNNALLIKQGEFDDLVLTKDNNGILHIQSADVPTKTFDFEPLK